MENNARLSDAELEAKLKPYTRVITLCSKLSIAAALLIILTVVLVCLHVLNTPASPLLIAGEIALIILLQMISAANRKKYNTLFMNQRGKDIDDIVASYFGPKPNSSENDEETAARLQNSMRESNLFGGWKRACINSFRKGSRKGMSFEAFNAVLEEEIRSESTGPYGDPEPTTQFKSIFDGCFFLCETEKDVPCRVSVQRIEDAALRESFSNCRTGAADFDEKYGVFASDPAKVSALLTPEMRQCILDLEALAGGEIGMAVQNRVLTLAVNHGHKFMDMDGADTAHISSLMTNLNASLERTVTILDKVLEIKALF